MSGTAATDPLAMTGAPSELVPAELIDRIVDVLHPEQIWLFGSRVRGEARSDSDWDLMVILSDDAPEEDLDLRSVWRRLRDLRLRRVEILTLTRSDFEAWRHSLGTLAEIVASTGIVIMPFDAHVVSKSGDHVSQILKDQGVIATGE